MSELEPYEGRIEEVRRALPEIAGRMTQMVVDNPGTFAMVGAGTIVATRAALNIVRPRNAIEALALMAVLQVGLPLLLVKAVERGWLKIKVRDDNGCLVRLDLSDDA